LLFAPLAGAIVPFLRRNWPPASVFMGDSGSLTIGFLIGCGGAALSRRFGDGTGLLAAFLLLALPLAEVAISATRRTLRGRSIFEADCQHLHHQFRRAGRDAQTLLLHMSAFSALAVLLASSLFLLGLPERILLLGFLAVLFLDELRDLAYLEFRVLGLALWGGGFQRWLQQQIELASLEKDLRAARSPEEVWRSLRAAAISLGVSELHLRLGDREWREVWKDSLATHAWQIRVDLPFSCFAVLFITSPIPSQIGHPSSGVAAILHRTLNAKRLERLLPVKAAPPTSLPEVVLLDRSA
jgi:UDP-GlcNAc:undecaprenyl-phosphate GlcNAc-1-phosphate transferase